MGERSRGWMETLRWELPACLSGTRGSAGAGEPPGGGLQQGQSVSQGPSCVLRLAG